MDNNKFMEYINPNRDLTLQQVVDKVKEFWNENNDSNSSREVTISEIDRVHEIKELIKSKFSFDYVNVGFTDKDDNRQVECSFDGMLWKTKKIYAHSPDHEVIEYIKTGISGKWDESYSLNPNSRILSEIINVHGLADCGYQMTKNGLFKMDNESFSLNEVVNTADVRAISMLFYDGGDLETLTLTTDDNKIVITEDECIIVPIRDCKCRQKE